MSKKQQQTVALLKAKAEAVKKKPVNLYRTTPRFISYDELTEVGVKAGRGGLFLENATNFLVTKCAEEEKFFVAFITCKKSEGLIYWSTPII